MDFQRIDLLHDYKKSPSSSPIEKDSSNAILTPRTAFILKEIPKPPEVWDSYISSDTNSGLSSLSCLLPTNECSQTEATSNAGSLKDQLSFPTLSQQLSDQSTTQSNLISIPGIDKNSKLELQHPDLNVSAIWEYLKLHEEKCNFLQQQMSCILEQKAVSCHPNPETSLVSKNGFNVANGIVSSQTSLDDVKICALGGDTESSKLLACLQAQREKSLKLEVLNQTLQEKIQDLQEENRKLQDRNNELINFLLKANSNSNKIDNAHSPKSLHTDPFIVDGSVSFEERNKQYTNKTDIQQETVPKETSSIKTSSSDLGNIEIRQEKEIEKTSTSTMTSVIYDGSDKVVYKKLTTVTTDFKKQCSELSAQCSVNKEAVVTPQQRPSPNCVTSSSRKKQLTCRKCGKCSPLNSSGKNKTVRNVSAGALENECGKNVKNISPGGIKTLLGVSETAGKKTDEPNTGVDNSPRYEKILRNVNELVLNFEEDEAMPRVKPLLKSKSKGRKKDNSSSRAIDSTPMIRKSENQGYSDRRQSSNSSSSESVNISSEISALEENLKHQGASDNTGSTTISMYGLSSPNLSKHTRQYLDNFGLVRDSSKTSRSRTTLVKRYLR